MDPRERCRFRVDVRRDAIEETAACLLLSRSFNSSDERLVRVPRDVCDACCADAGHPPTGINHVVASLIYERAHQQLSERPHGCDAGRMVRLKEECRYRLLYNSTVENRKPDALGLLGVGERRLPPAPPRGQELTWAVAVLTAPRRPATLSATLASLHKAGFEGMHLFAEPHTLVPPEWSRLPLIRHQERQGALRNFCIAAETLLERHPDVDCYAFFEDDVYAALGLRHWCDGEFWPGDHGIVSLYTSRVFCDDRPGWQTLNLGRYRTFGALAFVFRGSIIRELVADPDVRRYVGKGRPGADAVVGQWRGARHRDRLSFTLARSACWKDDVAGRSRGRTCG